ncbi:MAG: hypothetical protein HKN20_07280, partial [Gemmatimonadetes bacterium]|nr:hypothetical protein [Gemmatimonadota bacterium]
MCKANLRSAFLPIAVLLTAFVLPTQAGGSGSSIPGFPDASLTIYPVSLILTGPVEEHSRFAEGFRRKFESEATDHARTLGSLLKEEGFDRSEFEETKLSLPAKSEAVAERAAAFGDFVRDSELKTDYALCATFTLHLEKGFQNVHGVIVDRMGTVVWQESQGVGDPAFDEDPPGTELQSLELLCARLTIPMALDEMSDAERTGAESRALRELRAKEPPARAEFAAMAERLAAMKDAEAAPDVLVFPARVGGDHTDTESATNLSALLSEAD